MLGRYFIPILVLGALLATSVLASSGMKLKAMNDGNLNDAYCPNNCSYPQGTCDESIGCVCSAGFAGPDCASAILPIVNLQQVTGTLQPGTWAFYSMSITEAYVQLLVALTREGTQGDPDLYVRFGSAPDRTHYDFADFSVGQLHEVSLTRAASQLQTGDYYFGIYAYGSQSTTYTIQPRAYECLNGCSGHGTCDAATHTCACEAGWVMTDCSSSNTPLAAPTDAVSGTLDPMDWVYFELPVSQQQMDNDIDFYVQVNKTSSSSTFGYLDLYAAFNRFPNQNDWDYRANLNQNLNSFKICSSSLMAGTWRVGVMNYGFATQNYTLTANLIANCPNHCSGHGACNAVTGACTCAAGWGGGDCSYDINGALSGYTTVGTVVGLSFFFLILGAAPFIIYIFFGERIRRWFASRRGITGDNFTTATYPPPTDASIQGGSAYQTF